MHANELKFLLWLYFGQVPILDALPRTVLFQSETMPNKSMLLVIKTNWDKDTSVFQEHTVLEL